MDELVHYILRYGGRCRDCADMDGVCDRGTPCDYIVHKSTIEWSLKAMEYGFKHKFVENPFLPSEKEVWVAYGDDHDVDAMEQWLIGVYSTEEEAKQAGKDDQDRYVKERGKLHKHRHTVTITKTILKLG
ncbi:hypothetical protein phiOC_p350 [Ochrobactrum phage vB_OspM_OC]|nr:hypothetical protein phiOC_p350 [Ochrobactrum phage vB_OspM_OC]